MARYKYDTAHEWLDEYIQRNPQQAHSIAMTLARKLDGDSIQDEFQSDMDRDGFFKDLDEPDESEDWDVASEWSNLDRLMEPE